MFLYLSKLLPLFVYPLGLAAFLLLAALAPRRRPGLTKGLVLIALLLLWIGGNRCTAAALTRSLERQYPPLAEPPPADVIILLGGGSRTETPPRTLPEVSEEGDRIIYAARLYHQGKAPAILVSGGRPALGPQTGPDAAENMTRLLEMWGVPRDAIWQESVSQNTYENALYSRPLLAERGVEQALLVTSATHMPRAAAVFRKQGLNVIPAPVDFQVTAAAWAYMQRPDPANWLYYALPDAGALDLTTAAIKEYIGILVYGWRGWL